MACAAESGDAPEKKNVSVLKRPILKTEFVDAAPRLFDNGIKRGFRSSPSLSRAPPGYERENSSMLA